MGWIRVYKWVSLGLFSNAEMSVLNITAEESARRRLRSRRRCLINMLWQELTDQYHALTREINRQMCEGPWRRYPVAWLGHDVEANPWFLAELMSHPRGVTLVAMSEMAAYLQMRITQLEEMPEVSPP